MKLWNFKKPDSDSLHSNEPLKSFLQYSPAGQLENNFAKKAKDRIFQSGDQISIQVLKFRELIEKIQEIKAEFLQSILEIASYSKNLAAQSEELDAVMNHLKDRLKTSREITNLTKKASLQIVGNAENSKSSIETTIQNSEKILLENEEQIRTLSVILEDIKKIRGLIRQVREISDQTNLLSLNASIEAARAGEEGRGFSVVADGVSKLAEKSKSTVSSIEKSVESIMKELARWGEISQEKLQKVNSILQALYSIKTNVEKNLNAASESSQKIKEMDEIYEEFENTIQEVRKSSEVVSHSAVEMADTIETLEDKSNILNQVLDTMISETRSSMELITNQNMVWLIHFMQARRIDHINWVRKVRECIDKKTTEGFPEIRHTHCNMGRWYYQTVVLNEEHGKIHKKLEIPHLNLHKAGARILEELKLQKFQNLEPLWEELNKHYMEIALIFDEYHEYLYKKCLETLQS